MNAAEPRTTSRTIRELGRWAGASEAQLEQILREAPDVAALRAHGDGDSDGDGNRVLAKMVAAARLSALPGVDLDRARRLADQGVRVEDLATGGEEAGKLAATHRLSPAVLAAAAGVTGAARPDRPVRGFDGAPPPARFVGMLVAGRGETWLDLAKRAYAVDTDAQRVAADLAAANGARLAEEVPPGARLVLPEVDGAPSREADGHALAAFASYVAPENLAALDSAGFAQPEALLHLDPPTDEVSTGVPRALLERLRLQATAERAGMPAAVAHALAAVGAWITPRSLASANPVAVKSTLMKAAALKLLDAGDLSTATIVGWLGNLGQVVGLGSVGSKEPVDSPCSAGLPSDARVENVFDYRTVPAGITGAELGDALNQRLAYLDETLANRDTGALSASQADAYREKVFSALGVTEDQRGRWASDWGLDLTNETGTQAAWNKLSMLARYLRESADVTQLIKSFADGHEYYQRGELGLALTAYDHADAWFADRVPSGALSASIEPTASDPLPAGVLRWYTTVRPALSDVDFLDHLQTPWNEYQGFILSPWKGFGRPATAEEPFRRFLYQLRRFVLPLCRHDCHVELGNWCEALQQLLVIRHRAAYTEPLGAAEETEIAAGGARMPELGSAGLDPTGWGRFEESYLHDAEARLLDVKAARLMCAWGEYYERRASPRVPNDESTKRAKARYAQALRMHYEPWNAMRGQTFGAIGEFRHLLATRMAEPINPLALQDATLAEAGILRLRNGLNFIGYEDDYVPIWTYHFLLNSARYFVEQARQLERDSIQSLNSAEQELGSQRMLAQQAGTAASQLAVESRRVDEANQTVDVSSVALGVASIRRLNNLGKIADFDDAAPTLLALGSIGGAVGGAGSGSSLSGGNPYAMIVGAAYGGVSSYLSGSTEQRMQRSDMVRGQRELNAAGALARAELARSTIGADVARLLHLQAATTLAYAQSNVEFAAAKTLSADFWFAHARRQRDMARYCLDTSIRVAYLAEQALEFSIGRKIDRIKLDYGAGNDLLAADALLLDLDSLESERILTRDQKSRPIRHVVPLRIRDFQGFEQLKRDRRLRFDTTVGEFDLDYPGAYMLRIVNVEVELRALVPPGGIRGVLSKSGISWLRFRTGSSSAPSPGSDWIQHTPSAFTLAPFIQEDESMVLSTFDARRDAAILRPQDEGEVLRLFEGSGLGTSWELSLEPSVELDLSTVTDVNLVLYLTTDYDPELAEVVGIERGKQIALREYVLDRAKGYAFRDTLPDAFYHLLNPSTDSLSSVRRIVSFDAGSGDFPFGEVNRGLEGLSVAFLGGRGPVPMEFSISSAAHSPNYDPRVDDRTTLALEASSAATTDPAAPNVYAFTNFGQAPEDRWFLRLVAEDNPSLARLDAGGQPHRFRVDADGAPVLDPNGDPIPDNGGKLLFDDERMAAAIVDVWWIFRYGYELAGPDGDPIPFWSHPGTEANAHYAKADGTVGNAGWQPQDSANAWQRAGGVWTRNAGGSGQLIDGSPLTWDELLLRASVTLPGTAGAAAGLAICVSAPGEGYRLRVVVGNDLRSADTVLERVHGGNAAELARRDAMPIASGGSYAVTLESREGVLRATLDGVDLLRAVDPAPLPAGHVAVWGSGSGAAFGDVVVADLTGRP
jgi:hypothetical protein